MLNGGEFVGGVYSGFGVSSGFFVFVIVGLGEYVIIYIYIDVLGCIVNCIFIIIVIVVVLVELGDFVWLDENQNGLQDVGELGLGGVQVILE